MRATLVEQIAEAILFEGYILYPYRATTVKNRQRFTFGRVYPQAYSEAEQGLEPAAMQAECLVQGAEPQIRVRARFLQPVTRQVGKLANPRSSWDVAASAEFEIVPDLTVEDRLYQTWEEAITREVVLDWHTLAALPPITRFQWPDRESIEPITETTGRVPGVLRRSQAALAGHLTVSVTPRSQALSRLSVRLDNQTALSTEFLNDPQEVLLRTFASAHFILEVRGGEFGSLMDPPAALAAETTRCQNVGTFPVLVGDEQRQERHTLLCVPIILYDYPRLAPESPGDLCDGTEIDELLNLRIQTLSDREKWEMRQVDAFARGMLERTEALGPEQFASMHGAMRRVPPPFEEQIFQHAPRLERVCVQGAVLRLGDRVRIRPRARADVMDIALAGKAAFIEAIEQDAEGRVHLALVVEDDPGKDLGLLRQPGHRFFYGLDEVELIDGETS